MHREVSGANAKPFRRLEELRHEVLARRASRIMEGVPNNLAGSINEVRIPGQGERDSGVNVKSVPGQR